MKYVYYFKAIRCNRLLSEFIAKTDIGIEDFGIETEVYYMSTQKPSKIYIKKIENILKNIKNNQKLGEYLTNVKFLKVEEIQ